MPLVAQPAATTSAGAIRVLVLDDERMDRHRVARLFSSLNYHCAITNTQDLLEFAQELERESYDLILLDYLLPDGTGFEAVEMVQLSARNLNTPMLMISGQPKPDVIARARLKGCAGYLSKENMSKDAFLEVVAAALQPAQTVVFDGQDSFDTAQVAHMLTQCAGRCARDVKPTVSRLMRQLRNLRARSTSEDPQTLNAIEQNCLSLWTFLIEMERQDGAELLSDITQAIRPPDTIAQIAATRQSRPPSPFSTRRH